MEVKSLIITPVLVSLRFKYSSLFNWILNLMYIFILFKAFINIIPEIIFVSSKNNGDKIPPISVTIAIT